MTSPTPFSRENYLTPDVKALSIHALGGFYLASLNYML